MWSKNSFLALFTFVGAIVGAGVFGLPFVVAKAGIIPSIFYIIILSSVALLLQLLFGEINLRTRESHRLPGFAKRYLGERHKRIVSVATITGAMGSLLAYIIASGDFLRIIISTFSSFNISATALSFFFAFFLSIFIYKGIESISAIETFINIGFFIIVILLFGSNFSEIQLSNFQLVNLDNIFLPYGVILFAFMGWSAIPAISSILKSTEEKKRLKTVMMAGIGVIMILYLLFTISIVGVTGTNTTEEALRGLVGGVDPQVIALGALFGIFAFASSFLILGNYLKNILIYDFSIPHFLSFLIACGIPIFLFAIGFRRFINVVGIVGTVLGVVEGATIIFIFKNAKELGNREPEYNISVPDFILHLIIVIFVIGLIVQIL